VKDLRGVKMTEPCERTLRNRRRSANESLVEKSKNLRRNQIDQQINKVYIRKKPKSEMENFKTLCKSEGL
jgi:hypothetical protein